VSGDFHRFAFATRIRGGATFTAAGGCFRCFTIAADSCTGDQASQCGDRPFTEISAIQAVPFHEMSFKLMFSLELSL
jgi:hypothetical protein